MGVTKQPNLFKDTPIEELLNQVATMSDTMYDIVSTNFVPSSTKPNSVVLKYHDSLIEDPYNYWQCLKFARDFHLLDVNISFEREHAKRTWLVGTQKTNPIISSVDMQNKSHVVHMLSGISLINFTVLKRNAYKSIQDPSQIRKLRIRSESILGVNGYSLSSSTFEKYLPWPRYSENMMFYFDVDPTEIKATYKESSYELKIVGNDSVSIESNKDWCTVEPASIQGSGTVIVKVTRSPEVSDRTAAITLKSKTQTKHVNVIQTYRKFSGVTINGTFIDADKIPYNNIYDSPSFENWNDELNDSFSYAANLAYLQGDLEVTVHAAEGIEYQSFFFIFEENGYRPEDITDCSGTETITKTFDSKYSGKSVGFFLDFNNNEPSDKYTDIVTEDTYFICTFKVPGSGNIPKLSMIIYGEYEYHSNFDRFAIVYEKNVRSWLLRYAKEKQTAILVFGYYDLPEKVNQNIPALRAQGNPYDGHYSIEQANDNVNNSFYMFGGSTTSEDSILQLLESRLNQSSVDSSKVEILSSPCIFFLPTGKGHVTDILNEKSTWYKPEQHEKNYTYYPEEESFAYWPQQVSWQPYELGKNEIKLVYYEFEIHADEWSTLESVTPNSLVPSFFNIMQGSVYDSAINTILKNHLSILNDGLISQDNNVTLDVFLRGVK